MKRTAVILLIVVAVVAVILLNLPSGDGPGPIDTGGPSLDATGDATARAADLDEAAGPARADVQRTRAAVGDADPTWDLDPSVRAALTGFTGRVVDPNGVPVADSLVRIYRFAPDVLFRPNVGVFVEGVVNEPQIEAGEERTGPDGRFQIDGVFPRAMFLAHADADGDAPTWKVIQRSAPPGDLCDLGDIVLNACGVLTGRVMDRDGQPVPGALVRAVDLPGTLLSFVPLERFDPTGAIIVSEEGGIVITCPPWVERRFEQLPLAQTHTAADGTFRLTGVTPGGNLVAATARGLMSHVRPREVVKAGEEKDLGDLVLREGEFAYGKVVDDDNEPVAGAQVLVAGRSTVMPVHLASFTEPTDAEGVFELGGFPPGEIIAAARRRPGEPWVVTDAQPVTSNLVIVLPSAHDLTLEVVDAAGEAVASPRLQLTPGSPDNGSLEQAMWGVNSPVELESRRSRTEDGEIILRDLPKGEYTLLADSPAHAITALGVKLEKDTRLRVELQPRRTFDVRTVDANGAPVTGAEVFARAEGERPRVPDAPVHVGRTDSEGALRVDAVCAQRVALTASHPAYGNADAEVDLPAPGPIVLRFEVPGVLDGVVTDGGVPPPIGKWMVYIFPRGRGGDAAFPDMPELTAPDADGRFRFGSLRPGSYTVGVQSSLDVITSAGKVSEIVTNAFMRPDLPSERVDVPTGGRTEVVLDTLESKRIDGPVGRIAGAVTVDGRLGVGYLVQTYGQNGRRVAEVDTAGRFLLDPVAVGDVRLQLMERPSGDIFSMRSSFGSALWSAQVKVEEGKDVELTIDVQLGRIEGLVFAPDGSPAAGAMVTAQGKRAEGGDGIWLNQVTDAAGQFTFLKAPAGTYTLEARFEPSGRGRLAGIEVQGGVPTAGLRIALVATHAVRGTIDLTVFGAERPRRMWMYLEDAEGDSSTRAWSQVEEDGGFEFDDVLPGSYRVRIQAGGDRYRGDATVVVGNADVEGFAVRPVKVEEGQGR